MTANYDKVIEYFKKAISIQVQSLGNSHPYVVECYKNLGNAYSRTGKHAKAIECHEKALAVQLSRFGYKHPDVAKLYCFLGIDHYVMGQFGEAAVNLSKAFDIGSDLLGDEYSDVQNYNLLLKPAQLNHVWSRSAVLLFLCYNDVLLWITMICVVDVLNEHIG